MVLADFWKAFDTISFSATIVKFYKLGFSKPFLKWLLSYLSGRSQFVQIDNRKSSYHSSQYSVPQGSIVGTMIFNLYVSDLHEVTPSSMVCVQYADDTSLYSHFNVKELDSRAVDMNKTLVSITNWSQDSNLALNPGKTKYMLFSTPQMSSYHSLAERPIHLSVGDKPLERVHSIKLLGVHMIDTLKWNDHVKHLASSCYGVLAALRKIKNFTNYHLRKHFVECLVLSRLDFNDIIFHPTTDCLLKRLQRTQFAAASFVFGRYVDNIDSILKLGWLPMKERREWHVLKAVHKAIYSYDWPRKLQLEQVKHARNLRSSSTINLVIPYASETFQYSAATLFNSLPSNVKCFDNFKSFSKQTLCILRERHGNRAE